MDNKSINLYRAASQPKSTLARLRKLWRLMAGVIICDCLHLCLRERLYDQTWVVLPGFILGVCYVWILRHLHAASIHFTAHQVQSYAQVLVRFLEASGLKACGRVESRAFDGSPNSLSVAQFAVWQCWTVRSSETNMSGTSHC